MSVDIYRELKTLQILFIGNDEWIRDSMKLFFEDEGCLLHTLETAEEAIEKIKKNHYDLIIADDQLPGMDGITFFKYLQSIRPDTRKILIVFDKSKSLLAALKNLNINDLIEKPFMPDTLETSLKKTMKKPCI
jgi:DNA-binding NtrC family response regulator